MLDKIIVSEIMSSPPVVVAPESRVVDVIALAEGLGVHHFPIVEGGALVGFVCTCDLADAAPSARVSAFSRPHVVTVSEATELPDAARALAENAVGSAVVVHHEAVTGIVTRNDISAAGFGAWVAEARCNACHASSHLRPGPDGEYLCVDCHERSRADDWFDAGVGD